MWAVSRAWRAKQGAEEAGPCNHSYRKENGEPWKDSKQGSDRVSVAFEDIASGPDTKNRVDRRIRHREVGRGKK